MRTFTASLALTFALSTAVISGPYDGLYFQGNASCNINMVGSDGGPYKIQDNVFVGTEMGCDLTNPVNVRGMNATLFDGKCGGEGEEWEKRYMMMKSYDGIYMIVDGYSEQLIRCPE